MLHEEKMIEQKAKLDLFYGTQMFEVEERKNQQIKDLQDHHDLAFNDMKNYYNDITLNNLALIGSMKEQLEHLRKQAERSDRIAADTAAENRRLKEPLEHANIQLNEYRRKLEFYERDKQQLSRLKVRNTRLSAHRWRGHLGDDPRPAGGLCPPAEGGNGSGAGGAELLPVGAGQDPHFLGDHAPAAG